MHITALTGGIGGARFLTGLLNHLDQGEQGRSAHRVSIIANTADDITLHGLRVCPDLDTVMYTLGGGANSEQGWGREAETFSVAQELAAYDAGIEWFTLGDKDFATHIVRTRMLGLGYPLSQVTAALATRWGLTPTTGVELLPMTDAAVETHVVVETGDLPESLGPRATPGSEEGQDDPSAQAQTVALHFQEWWVRHHAQLPAKQIVALGIDKATPAPGVLEAIRDADVILLPPSNPVVSIGTILSVPGIRDALRGSRAPVIGLSPIVGGKPVRGMADACLQAIGVPTTALAVGGLYADFLDAWLVDNSDAELAGRTLPNGRAKITATNLLMTDLDATTAMAAEALSLAQELR